MKSRNCAQARETGATGGIRGQPSLPEYGSPEAVELSTEESGGEGMRERACRRAREVLAEHFPRHIDDACDAMLRDVHDILIPREAMRAGEAG